MGTGLIVCARCKTPSGPTRRAGPAAPLRPRCFHRCPYRGGKSRTEQESAALPPSLVPKNPIQPEVASSSLVLYTMKYTGSKKNNNEKAHTPFSYINSLPLSLSLYLHKRCQLISLVYNVITVKLREEMCHPAHFPASITRSST